MSIKGQKCLKILFFDIETTPVKAWTFAVGPKIRLGHNQICKGQKFDVICICYNWQGESKIHSLDWGYKAQNSSKMIERFTKEVEKADIVIAHNADRFDIKQLNTQRLLNDQSPIPWPTSEDTLKQFRKHFYFPSFKLDYLAQTLLGQGKDNMNLQDWINIVDQENIRSFTKMIRYCKRDVRLLKGVLNRAKKHMSPKVHEGIFNGNGPLSCPRCPNSTSRSIGVRATSTRKYQRRMCNSCGHAFKGPLIKD